MSAELIKSLELLVLGWGGVFVVILIIYLASMLLSRLFPVRKKKRRSLYMYTIKRLWLEKDAQSINNGWS